jgi:hypothetical protein
VRRWCVATLLVITALCAASSADPATAAPASSTGGNVEPALDTAAPDSVAVAASGAPVDGVVPVLVRNGTTHRVEVRRVRAAAVDGSGRTTARATTRLVVPNVLEPDGLGLARVDFDDPRLPASVTYRFDVTSRRAREPGTVALEPTMFQLSPPSSGPVAQTLDVTLRNPGTSDVRGPVRIAVMCFGEARRPTLLFTKTSPIDRIAPGASTSAAVELRELCPTYLVAANAIRSR